MNVNPSLRPELRKDGQEHVLDHEAALFDPSAPIDVVEQVHRKLERRSIATRNRAAELLRRSA